MMRVVAMMMITGAALVALAPGWACAQAHKNTTKTTTVTTKTHTMKATAPAPAEGGGIVAGRYTCIAGSGPMLTLGEMTITGSGYRFHAPTGADTTGAYGVTGGAIRWNGDLGAIKNARITQSGFDAHQPDFWFKYFAYDGAKSPTTAACQKL